MMLDDVKDSINEQIDRITSLRQLVVQEEQLLFVYYAQEKKLITSHDQAPNTLL